MKKHFIFILILGIFVIGCKKDEKDKEKELLTAYLQEHNITQSPTASGLYYIETLAGTGAQPVVGSWVAVHYTGFLIDSTKFDSSYDTGNPLEFKVGSSSVIEGMDEGVRYMKKGGKATFIIPSGLAYGSSQTGSIPSYSTLIFNVELIEVQNK